MFLDFGKFAYIKGNINPSSVDYMLTRFEIYALIIVNMEVLYGK